MPRFVHEPSLNMQLNYAGIGEVAVTPLTYQLYSV
jgi:hypothetical protein